MYYDVVQRKGLHMDSIASQTPLLGVDGANVRIDYGDPLFPYVQC